MNKKTLMPFVPQWILNRYSKITAHRRWKEWKENGCPVPPPHLVKQMTVGEYQDKYQYNVFVETGTFLGDMVEAQKRRFKRIFSIELGLDLYNKAVKRFKNNKNITIIQGDSGKVLSTILLEITEPAIFWLDSHYSEGITARGEKNCPIFEELNAIFDNKKFNHILLIDDARCFIGKDDYPTINQLTEYIKSKDDNYRVEVKNDIIRYVI